MIPKLSVKKPYTVVVGVVLIILLGYVSFTSMQTDLLPDMTLPYAIVYTTYPGASPEEVETIVTRPVEQSMATISNIETINSISSENLSMVILQFAQSANMDAVTIEMRESLDQIEGYWDDTISSPVIMKLNPDMLPVMVSAMEAGDMSQSDLTTLVNNEILPELESIEGVASVTASGTIEEQVQVLLKEEKIKAVNRQITDALDKKFREAEDEIAEAQAKLDEGQKQLKSGQTQLADQTSQAESKLDGGSSQMITGEIEIDKNLEKIESGLAQLDTAEKELEEKEKELLDGEKQLAQLPQQKAALEVQLTQLNAGITQLESAPTQYAQLQAAIMALDVEIARLEAQIKALGGEENSDQTQTGAGEESVGADQTQTGAGETAGNRNDAEPSASLTPGQTSLTRSEDTFEIDLSDELDAPDEGGEAVAETGNAEPPLSQETQDSAGADDVIIEDSGLQAGGTDSVLPETDGNTVPDLSIISREEIDQFLEENSVDTTLAKLQAELAAKQGEKAALQAQEVQAKAALAQLGVNTDSDYLTMVESIGTVKSGLVSRKQQLEDGISEMQSAIDDMDKQLASVTEGKAAIEEGKIRISSQRKELEAAKQKLETAKKQIADGQITMDEAAAQLNSAKITATIQMAAGQAELNFGQKELDAALEQIKAQKETAYEQADITEIITKDMVKNILAAQNFSMPAGYVTEDGTDFLVRVGNKFYDTEELGNLVLLDMHMDDVDPITLDDVAEITVIDDSDTMYASVNGKTGVMFSMQKQSGYSTGNVSDKIKKKFRQLEEKYGDVHIIELMDQGIYIDLVVDSVLENMISGAVLAILVLLVFLKSFRSTFVIACSIPISIMTALVLMYFSNISLNIISLSGLALGIGMLVDNSIVVIENIYRLKGEGYSAKKAAVEGASQVAGAIAASTLTTICVFVPIVFTEGITRQLFVDMGLTIAYSLVASLVIALTLVPMMGAGLLKNARERRSRLFEALQRGYTAALRLALKLKFLVVLASMGLLVYSGYLSISKGTAFMPSMESTQISVTVQAPEGSTLQETAALSDEVIARIMTIQDVANVGAMNGSGSMNLTGGSGQSENEQVSMYVLMDEEMTISNSELADEILEKTKDLACEVTVNTSTMDMSSLGSSGLSINIKGRELDQLKQMAADVAAIVEKVEGTENVSDGIEEKTLEMRLVVDKNKAIGYQLTTAQVYQMLQQKLAEASSATTLSTLSKDYSVLVVSDTDETLTREKIKELTITGTDEEGKSVDVPLRDLVDFQDTEGFSSIMREAQTRYVTVSAGIDGDHNIGLVSAEVEKQLADYEVPEGYSIEMAGEDETINEAMGEVLKMLALALVFMYLIMVAQFQSLLSPFIIMFTIPLAFTGGFLGLYLTDSPVSVIAMIGFVMLSGIIVNNGIVLVDYINQLRRNGMEKKEAILEAGRTRLRPIIMTALTTILGLSTMAMGMGMGADMVQPMAIVTIGGLTYGTVLTLFVVPCIYDILNRKKNMAEEEI